MGRVLSKAGLYLQHPRFLRNEVRYENPHYNTFPGFEDQHPELPGSLMTLRSQDSMPKELDVSNFFDGLDQHEHLKEVNIDEKFLTTKLQRYLHHLHPR